MIQYYKGRFRIPGISFTIPDGFYINTAPDSVADNYLCLLAPNKEYSIHIQSLPLNTSISDELQALLINTQESDTPTPITVNSLYGYHVSYKAGREQYYELRLQYPIQAHEYGQLSLLIQCAEAIDLKQLLESKYVRSMITGIFPDPITQETDQL